MGNTADLALLIIRFDLDQQEGWAWLSEGATFVLNILDESQTDMVGHFGRGFALTEPAFTGLDLERSPLGHPVLAEAHAYLECQVEARHPAGLAEA